jgi:NAD+ diphosphatase
MSRRTESRQAFAGGHLERRVEARLDPDWPGSVLVADGTRFLLSHGTRHLIRRVPTPQIAFVGADHPAVLDADPSQLVLLGWFRDAACVLVDATSELAASAELAASQDLALEELRPLLPALPQDEAELLACARALLVWRGRHRHCGVCGAPTAPRSAGHVLRCTSTACGEEFFPRIDPAIIVLVACDDEALLGRQASWPPGRYSALAGFVEAGESLEAAVRREVAEETGVHVEEVRYFNSQPWPFPASLMLAFHARAARVEPRLTGELEDARWFRADELRALPAAALPPTHTIARGLIDTWLAGNRRRRARV